MVEEPTEGETASVPKTRSVERVAFDSRATDRIAETLGVDASRAPFQLPGATVWQLLVSGANERPSALVTLWPSLRRVDVITGPVAIVFTDVTVVDLVARIEVQFRRGNNDCLIVARGGKVIVRA